MVVPFAYVSPGFTSPVQVVFVTNTGDAPLTISALTLEGAQPGDFAIAHRHLRAAHHAERGGALPHRPRHDPGEPARAGSQRILFVHTTATMGEAEITLMGDVDPALSGLIFDASPSWIDFGMQGIGDTCIATVTFAPTAAGPRSTELATLMTYFGADGLYRYSITGTAGGAPQPVSVVEYYNATLDHYFITWIAAEQANLDAGNTPTRWVRTGYSFNAYTMPQTGTSNVCRYYIPPGLGDSHFFGRGTAECDATGAAHPTFVLEDSAFMYVFLPAARTCPAGTTPIYRVFSNRPDANHRYMTDRAVRDQMVARGWLAEGDGPDLVVMCGV